MAPSLPARGQVTARVPRPCQQRITGAQSVLSTGEFAAPLGGVVEAADQAGAGDRPRA
jgi:hypothetical protein